MGTNNPSAEAERIVQEYLKGTVTLASVSEIYESITDNEEDFGRWDKAAKECSDIDWSSNPYSEFRELARKAVEAERDTTSESYFQSDSIAQLSGSRLLRILSDGMWFSDSAIETFNPQEVGGVIRGELVYDKPTTSISRDYTVRKFSRKRAVEYEMDKSDGVVRVSSAGSKAQRLRGILNNKVGLKVDILGNLTTLPNQANDKVQNFQDEFNGGIANDIAVKRYNKANLYSPNIQTQEIENLNYKARRGDILDNPEIKDRLDNGWIVQGFTMQVGYKSNNYEISVAGTRQISYARVDKISNYYHGKEIMEILQKCFLKHFG